MKFILFAIMPLYATIPLLSQTYKKVEINTNATLISPDQDSTDVYVLFEEADTFEVRNLELNKITRISKARISEIIWDYPFIDEEIDTEGKKHTFNGSLVLLNYDNINAAAADMGKEIKDLCYGKIGFVEGNYGLFFSLWLYDQSWSISFHSSNDEKYLIKLVDTAGASRSMEIHSMDKKMKYFQSEDKLRSATYAEILTLTLLNNEDLKWLSKRKIAEIVVENNHKGWVYEWKSFKIGQYKKNVLNTQLGIIEKTLQGLK